MATRGVQQVYDSNHLTLTCAWWFFVCACSLLLVYPQELARLWDWQQRRAALGMSPDLPPVSAAAAVAAGSSSSSSGAASIPIAAGGELPLESVQAAAAAVAAEEEEEEEEGEEEVHSSSSSDEDDAAVWDPLDPAALEEFANKGASVYMCSCVHVYMCSCVHVCVIDGCVCVRG
jgi:hypothetical protein